MKVYFVFEIKDEFVNLYYGQTYTLEALAHHFYYSVRQMERINKKVREMVKTMPDIVNGDVIE